MSELLKDLQYLQATLRQQFNWVIALKLSAIPVLMYAIDFLGRYFESFAWPTWISHIFTIVILGFGLLFVITRKARTLEEPKLLLSPEPASQDRETISPSDFIVGVQNAARIKTECVEVMLTKIICDQSGANFVNTPCPFLDEENSRAMVSLNPLKMKYLIVGSILRVDDHCIFRIIVDGFYKKYKFNKECIIELEASSHNSPVKLHKFSIENKAVGYLEKIFILGKIE